jgi:hypothetical protein
MKIFYILWIVFAGLGQLMYLAIIGQESRAGYSTGYATWELLFIAASTVFGALIVWKLISRT